VSGLIARVLDLHGLVVYLIIGALVFGEDALLIGFVLPGETAALIGGVAASRHRVSLAVMIAVVVLAAIVGDSVGYAIGSRYGSRLLELRVLRRRRERVERARRTLRERGGIAVLLGRFVAFLRATMPFLAGSAHLRYSRFLAYNAAGGVLWGAGVVLVGYLAGNSYVAVEHTFGPAVAGVALALLVIAIVVWRLRGRRSS
jgi:membrane protein DedA with SNARE-associated domain